jgi:alpha-tubulin suppressor-like RCC1 family protein
VDIYSSRNGSLVVRKDGSLWGWGALPSRWGEDTAVIKGVNNAAKVLSEDLVLLKDGTVRAVGLHPRAASARMDGMKDIADVSFGYNINMVLKKDGRLFAWKLDSYSENVWKPNGDNDEFMLPLDDIVEISAGVDHALARDKAGNVWTWGDNDFGQLGDGTTAESEVPLKVKELKKVVEISAGPFFSLALQEDGKVFSWGQNNNGQLGDRTNKNRKTPVKVHILHNVKHISAGRAHCLAIVE